MPGKFLTEADLESAGADAQPEAAWKTVLLDAASGKPVVPNGSMGFRYADSGVGRWNLDLEGVTPALSIRDVDDDEVVEVLLPCFEAADGSGSVLRRGVPVMRIGNHVVTTVFDLMLAQHGVARPDLPGSWPTGYDDPTTPYTPAWQAEITSVPAEACIRIAREFATNAEQSNGRSMRGVLLAACALVTLVVVYFYALLLYASLVMALGANHAFTLLHYKAIFTGGMQAIRDTLVIAAFAMPLGGLYGILMLSSLPARRIARWTSGYPDCAYS